MWDRDTSVCLGSSWLPALVCSLILSVLVTSVQCPRTVVSVLKNTPPEVRAATLEH